MMTRSFRQCFIIFSYVFFSDVIDYNAEDLFQHVDSDVNFDYVVSLPSRSFNTLYNPRANVILVL